MASKFPDMAWSLRGQLSAKQAVAGVARLERLPRDRPVTDLRELEAIRVPTLVIANRHDPIHPLEFSWRLANAIPRALLVEVTSRSVNRKRHSIEVQQHLARFLSKYSRRSIGLGAAD